MTTRTWYDEKGQAYEAPTSARTCFGRYDAGLTHSLFAPDNPAMLQALTMCGRRAGLIPGGDVVDCPRCLEARK